MSTPRHAAVANLIPDTFFCCAIEWARPGGESQRRKIFFFEKKKQNS
jgi:hypothetical protein